MAVQTLFVPPLILEAVATKLELKIFPTETATLQERQDSFRTTFQKLCFYWTL